MPSKRDPLSIFDDPKPEVAEDPAVKAMDLATKLDSRKKAVYAEVVKALMEHPQGREWIYDKLQRCNVFGIPFTPDPQLTAFNCGALFVGQEISNEILATEENNYVLMRQEARLREESSKAQSEKITSTEK
jgi:hypothetical protein